MSVYTTFDRPISLFNSGNDERFLSRASSTEFENRILAMTRGGGTSQLNITSAWEANIRWARNRVISGGDSQHTVTEVRRVIQGSSGSSSTDRIDDKGLEEMVRRAENLTLFQGMDPDVFADRPLVVHPHLEPKLWFDSTYNLDAASRGQIAGRLIASAADAGHWSAGYIQVAGNGVAVRNSANMARYYPYTSAQYSVTVRDPKGTGSGWAGVDFNDWNRIDADTLSQIALDKCIKSRNPVAVEPGRYVAILEPQAVCDLWAPLMDELLGRGTAEEQQIGPFATTTRGLSKITQKVLDERITVSADPMDPDCGFVPFDYMGEPYRPVKWIENGVLKELSYSRMYAVSSLGSDHALPNSRAFRISGGDTSIEEMIESTERGILVTRFNNISIVNPNAVLLNGNTRDGLWLIEKGKVTKALKNFRISESPMFIMNNIESLGKPQRVFRPSAPAVCPPMKVRDFYFSGMMDAV